MRVGRYEEVRLAVGGKISAGVPEEDARSPMLMLKGWKGRQTYREIEENCCEKIDVILKIRNIYITDANKNKCIFATDTDV